MKSLRKLLVLAATLAPFWFGVPASATCTGNPIVVENCQTGTPQNQWDISGAGDSTIQGFATDISVPQGQTINFKISTPATGYHIDIYRMGYYGGMGARLITTIQPSVPLPQTQPACLKDSTTGLIDCGNWAVSASWTVPPTATSGIYFGKLVRNDTGGASHVVFVVRNDSSTSDILFKTSDTSWEAYNDYGGANLYTGGPGPQGGAYKVSYNRPFHTRVYEFYSWVFNAEYPMVRFLEANGYDVSYFTSVDADRLGSEILQHKMLMSVGHDEYWSGNERTNVENARAAGVNLAFITGNGIFWKTRLENSIDGSSTPNRTLVCYKETHANAVIDPQDPPTWTGTWRDPRFSPPADGGRPENGLSGTIFMINGPTSPAPEIQVPQADGQMRFWRNTSIAGLTPGQVYTTNDSLLGYEWDVDADNGFRPAGLFDLSTATYNISGNYLLDFGSTYGNGTATHHATMYRYVNNGHSALVFGSGTSQWPWALDGNHDGGSTTPDPNLEQATVNLLADMGVQPGTLQGGLVQTSASTDTAPPTSTITTPAQGSSVQAGTVITIAGTASDTGGGTVGGVEVSVDGGTTWHPVSGRSAWTYNWSPTTSGAANIRSRAVDDSGNLETPSTGVSLTVAPRTCPCSIWSGATPGTIDSADGSSVELGVRFRADVSGFITGIRFYKASTNTGTHIGNLWDNAGNLLASATFSGESTSGWQQVNFNSPVPIAATTTYVASYFAPVGHYSADNNFFATSGVDNAPLHALANGVDGSNGIYNYGSTSTFPTSTFESSNYWVDVVFSTSATGGGTPAVMSVSPANGTAGVSTTTAVSAIFNEALNSATVNASTFQLLDPTNTSVSSAVSYNSSTSTATLLPNAALAPSTQYRAVITGGSSGVQDTSGDTMPSNFSWTFTTSVSAPPPGSCPCSVWSKTTVPGQVDGGDATAGEYGFRFRSDVNGTITGIRYYKSTTNTGTHIGNLWTNSGALLGSVTFTEESASGWQQANFASPVQVTANTTYIASYFTSAGHYSFNGSYFVSAVDNSPLHALADGTDGANGIYNYGSASVFPTSTFSSSNYWVDVVFMPTSSTTPPTVTSVTPVNGVTGVSLGPSVTASFSEPLNASSVNSSTFTLVDSSNNAVPATVSYTSSSATATLKPNVELSPNTVYTATLEGGPNGITDFNGNALASNYVWSFTTGGAPASFGPGGPILVITSALNPFTNYFSEILNAEGLNEYTAADIATITGSTLANYDIAILGDMSLTSSQVSMLTNWVTNGGKLIAMHPDKQLSTLTGLTPSSATLSNAYLLVNTSSGPGAGIVGQSIQFHGTADMYTLAGATGVATLFSNASTPTNSPAVSLMNFGAGQVAAFTFDLARSIVYTRQGNPAWSGEARDGQSGPIRSDDLFFGAASFDPEPDWVDLSKVAIPQADEQQHLLANLIVQMNLATKPLPRFWFLPNGFKAAVVMTGDDHGSFYSGSATANRFNDFVAASPAGCSVANWQCVRATAYLFPQDLASTTFTDAQAASYIAQGFEVSVHADSSPTCSNWTTTALDSFYTTELASFASQLPSVPAPQTHRMHCIGWSDYDSQPQIELKHGIRLDTSYYYWPPTWVNDVPGMFTGSGMPMRYTDRNGNIINVYQATTQMTDESGQTYPFNIDTLLGNAVGSTGYYGVFTANMHNDGGSYPGPGANQIVASAQANGVPVVSSLQMLQWLDGRNSSSFGSFSWNGSVLNFTVTLAPNTNNMQGTLPMNSVSGTLASITRNGSAVPFSPQTIKGIQYAFFNAAAGSYTATYSGSTTNVTLSSVTLNPNSVTGGSGSTGTVTLSGAAPTNGAVVTLASDNAVAQIGQNVTVPAGSTTATFSITTTPVGNATIANVSGTYGVTQSAPLTVNPAVLLSVTLNPSSVIGGSNSTGTVTLNAAAPAGGAVVTLSSGNTTAAQVPPSVTVLANATTATFQITTSPVAASTPVSISGTYGATQSGTLTVNPPGLASVTLNPSSVTGGSGSTGTVTLNAAAPAGGAVVTLSSGNTAAAQVPPSVTVLANATTATFQITTSPVATSTPVSISGTYGAVQSGTLTVVPPLLASVAANPATVTGGAGSTGTVTLNAAAPFGGALVTLSSGNAAVQVPANVTVLAGANSATFGITTRGVASSTPVAITGTYGVNQSGTLTVNPPALASLSLNPTTVLGGNSSTGTVTLSAAASSAGAIVTLSSTNSAVQVPASVTVAAGATSATFTITTTPVAANTSSTITATCVVSKTANLNVNAAVLSSIGLSPATLLGGNNSTGTVRLNGAAPAGGAVITLQSGNTSVAQVPASGTVTIPAGATSATFTIATTPVASNTPVVVSATYGAVTRNATLTVNAAVLSSFARTPGTLVGGNNATGTITLNGAAPAGGATVTLQSSNTSAAQMPPSVTIPAGSTSTTFTITTSGVASQASVTLTAVYGNTRTATLTVNPAALSSLTLSPSTVIGGSSSTGTLSLNGAAPPSGAVVSLVSGNTKVAQVPSSATIPAGSSSVTFTVTTNPVHGTSAKVSGTYRGTTRSATLTVQ